MAISIQNLNLSYHDKVIFNHLNLELPQNKRIAIIGPNGAGKTSLLKAILGLVPCSGDVKFFNQALKKQRQHIAYVPQRSDIDWDFPINVMDVVLMGRHGQLKFWQRPSAHDRELAQQALQTVELSDFAHHGINELSGGQQQRVFIARALAQQAKLYIMDEPFAGVDMATEKAITELFLTLQRQGQTLLCVHHDLNTLRDYFDYVVMVNQGIIASGSLDQVLNQEHLQATFAGRLPLLENITGAKGL